MQRILAFTTYFLLFVFITNASEKDSIDFALFTENTETFVTVTNKGKKLTRWQNYTGNFLTEYQQYQNPIIAVYENHISKTLIGLSAGEIIAWDIQSGNIIESFTLPESTSNLRLHDNKFPKIFSDYLPQKNLLTFTVYNALYVFDITSKKITLHKDLENPISSPLFVDQGNSIIGIEKYAHIEHRLFEINIVTGRISYLDSSNNSMEIAINSERSQFTVLNNDALAVYDAKCNKISQATFHEPVNRSGASVNYLLPNLLAIANYSLIEYINIENGSAKSVFMNGTSRNTDVANNMMLFWNSSNVSIRNILGEDLFETELSSIEFLKERTLSSRNEVFRSTTPNNITSVYVSKNGFYTTTNTGVLNVLNKNQEVINSETILSTPITHFNLINDEIAFIAGFGRGSIYNLNKKEHLRILNGHNGNIIGSSSISDQFLITAGQDKKIVLWDIKKGVYVADLKFEKTPLSISQNINNNIIIEFTDKTNQQWEINSVIKQYQSPERKMLLSTTHSDGIESLEFSSNGNLMLSTDMKGNLKIWDVSFMIPLFSIKIGTTIILKALFNEQNNEVIAYGTNTIYHVDFTTGKIKKEREVPPLLINNIGLHKLVLFPENPLVIINNNKDNSQYAYHTGSGYFLKLAHTEHLYAPYGIAIDATNKKIATFGTDHIDIWSLDKIDKPIRRIENSNKSSQNIYGQRKIVFNPSGDKLLYEKDADVNVYSLNSDQEIFTIKDCSSAKFITNDEIIFSFGKNDLGNKTIMRYNLTTKDTIFKVDLGDNIAYQIEYDKSNDLLSLGYPNGDVHFINASSGMNIKQNFIKNSTPNAKFNPTNGYLATTVLGNTLIFDWKNLKLKNTLDYNTISGRMTPEYQFSPNGKYLIQSYSNLTQFYDPHSLELIFDFRHKGSSEFKVSSDNNYIAFASMLSKTIPVYDIKEKKLIYDILIDDKHFLTDYQLITDETDAYIWAMIQKEKPDKEKSGNKVSGINTNNFNTYVKIYNLKDGKTEHEVLIGDSNYIQNFSFTNNLSHWFYRSDWRELTVIDIQNKKKIKHKINIDDPLDDVYPDLNSSNILITDDAGWLHFMDIETGVINDKIKIGDAKISDIHSFEDSENQYLVTSSEDGSTKVWDYNTKDLLITLFAFSENDYIFIDPEGYYSGTRGISEVINFKEKTKVYRFDQFDLLYNRPDIMLKKLNDNTKIQHIYHTAYLKRLKKLGYDSDNFEVNSKDISVPILSVQFDNQKLQTDKKEINFAVKAQDEQHKIQTLHVWINGVPLYGVKGLIIENPKKNINQKISLNLSPGKNSIRTSVINQAGIESLKETFYVTYTGESPKPKTYYIGIGISAYKNKSYNLTYATKDINDLKSTFSYKYPDLINYQLTDSLATRENILSIKNELLNTNIDDLIIISFSGHGILDEKYDWYYATYDMDFDSPAKLGLNYEEIEWLLDGIPARKKLLLIDACHSGEVDKETLSAHTENNKSNLSPDIVSIPLGSRGSAPINLNKSPVLGMENSFELMQELFANLSKDNGSVVISASGGMEYAFEGEKWNNGVFTYTILNGLNENTADFNHDGKITVNELKKYVSKQVEKLTNGKQKPTSRQENLENDFRL